MQEKMRAYLDELFAMLPATEEVASAKEELYAGMAERYSDCLLEGMDEQEAYDSVIDSVGDLHELFDELRRETSEAEKQQSAASDAPPEAEQTAEANEERGETYKEGYNYGFNVHEFIDNITNFTSGLVSGLFGGNYTADMALVNTRTIPLDGISNVEVSYISESVVLRRSSGNSLVVHEYMNRDDPALFANINLSGSSVSVRAGRRQGVFGLRSRIEILLPATFDGSLELGTVSGSVTSDEEWRMSSFTAKTVSGEVQMRSVTAGMIRLSSTSGTVWLERGAGTMDIHSISGSIRVPHAEGGGSFKTTSGTVRVQFEELSGHVEASSVSGGVRLGLPAGASFEFEGRSVSGNIHTGFDGCLTFQKRSKAHGFVGTAPYYHVRASSTSGGIHVND